VSLAPLAKRLLSYARTRGCKMTLPASGPISIANIHTEYSMGATSTDLNSLSHLGAIYPVSRSKQSPVSLSHFYGRAASELTLIYDNTFSLIDYGSYRRYFSTNTLLGSPAPTRFIQNRQQDEATRDIWITIVCTAQFDLMVDRIVIPGYLDTLGNNGNWTTTPFPSALVWDNVQYWGRSYQWNYSGIGALPALLPTTPLNWKIYGRFL